MPGPWALVLSFLAGGSRLAPLPPASGIPLRLSASGPACCPMGPASATPPPPLLLLKFYLLDILFLILGN